ncbi:MAG: DUF5801 repeats-in-toxin domain-containing protein, partial [Mesorhizobium sp.]
MATNGIIDNAEVFAERHGVEHPAEFQAQLMAQAEAAPAPATAPQAPAAVAQQAPVAAASQADTKVVEVAQDNTVKLPAGTSIEKIEIDGDSLVLVQPDGTRIVIEHAALHVPTFVIDDVEIPQEALVAALQANQIDVAAGLDGSLTAVAAGSESAGGNFNQPFPGIGDAGPIIDLLPPTALQFGALEERELFPAQTLKDDAPVILSVTGFERVDEDGLPNANDDAARAGEVDAGGMASATAQVVVDFGNDAPANLPGAFAFTNPDELSGKLFAIGGEPIEFTLENGVLVGRAGGEGDPIIEISVKGATATPGTSQVVYELELKILGPIQHGVSGEDFVELNGIAFTVTDKSGDVVPGSINASIADDIPVSAGDQSIAISVDEDGLGWANQDDGRDGEETGSGNRTVTGNAGALNALVNFGADGAHATEAFSLKVVEPEAFGSWTSGGKQIVVVSDGSTLHGYVDGDGGADRAVFDLIVGADGSYTFTL